MKILNRIYSFFVTLFFALEFMFSIIITIVAMKLFIKHNREIRRFWSKTQLWFLNCKVEVVGELNTNAQMLILNHQSILDIVLFEAIHPKNICWIAKKEISELPIFGKVLSVPKMIPIDRKNPRAMPQIITEVKDRVSHERPIMIFPEGTRGNGKELLKFHNGAKSIADKLNLIVQPALIVGSRRLFDSKKFQVKSGKVKIVYLPTIDRNNPDWLQNAHEDMKNLLNQYLHELI